MVLISVEAGARRRTWPRIATALRHWPAQARDRRRLRREMDALSRLSPHLLRDMGLEHYAAQREPTYQSPWQ